MPAIGPSSHRARARPRSVCAMAHTCTCAIMNESSGAYAKWVCERGHDCVCVRSVSGSAAICAISALLTDVSVCAGTRACVGARARVCVSVGARGSVRACAHMCMGKKTDHVKCAFAIPDLRFESVQVWPGRIDLCDVPPPLPELVDRDSPADKERDGGYDGRQAECDPHLPEGNGPSSAKAGISTTNMRERTPTCMRACGGCTPGR